MGKRVQGVVILGILCISGIVGLVVNSQRPTAEKLCVEISTLYIVENNTLQMGAAQKKLRLIERLRTEFPEDLRGETFLRDFFGGLRTVNAATNDILVLAQSADAMIERLPSEQSPKSLIYQKILTNRGQTIDPQFREYLVDTYVNRGAYQSAIDTVTWLHLYPDDGWKSLLQEKAIQLGIPANEISFARALSEELGKPFELTGTEAVSNEPVSTSDFPANKIIVASNAARTARGLKSFASHYGSRAKTLGAKLVVALPTSFDSSIAISEFHDSDIAYIISDRFELVPKTIGSLLLYIDNSNTLIAVGDENSHNFFKFDN